MSCWVHPAGIDPPGVAAADASAVAAAALTGVAAAALEAADAAGPDGVGVSCFGGTVIQWACDPGAQAAMPATTSPPPATAAPRRKPRRETPLSAAMDADSEGLADVTVS